MGNLEFFRSICEKIVSLSSVSQQEAVLFLAIINNLPGGHSDEGMSGRDVPKRNSWRVC